MESIGLASVATFGLAKEQEELFRPGQSEPIRLPLDSEALFLVQRVRDEAHRFAITFHRVVRKKDAFASALDGIRGLGPDDAVQGGGERALDRKSTRLNSSH